jgi:hypothetical protein
MNLQELINSEDPKVLKALFAFDLNNTDEEIIFKFNLWSRKLFPKYFASADASFHHEINLNNLKVYRGVKVDQFIDIAFRGAGKDVKTKLFIAFVILNDTSHFRKYFKILAEDGTNSKQSATDIYNMLVNPNVTKLYPETFEKTVFKREETMGSFTTATGIKLVADTVGTEQRGAIQEEARPDFIWFNDFETRKTLRSAVTTRAIWDNMEEARTGLQKGGGGIYTCNYVSELGNVHRLVTENLTGRKVVLIVPIMKDGIPTWDRYTVSDIDHMKATDDDFAGERMCEPSASGDLLIDRSRLNKMEVLQPIQETGGFKMFRPFDPSHRYGSGHDVAGGVGLDSSTSVFIDFSTIPAQVVATYRSNTIIPESFGDEIYREGTYYGLCIQAVENNKYDQAILKAKMLGAYLYSRKKAKEVNLTITDTREYGWATNKLTKPKMVFDFSKAVNDGLIELNDPDLIRESKSFSRNELIDDEEDPRLVTRHFDLFIAACIAWQMKDHATAITSTINYQQTQNNVPMR